MSNPELVTRRLEGSSPGLVLRAGLRNSGEFRGRVAYQVMLTSARTAKMINTVPEMRLIQPAKAGPG